MPLTQRLGRFAAHLSPDRLPEEAVRIARLGLTDGIATMIAGVPRTLRANPHASAWAGCTRNSWTAWPPAVPRCPPGQPFARPPALRGIAAREPTAAHYQEIPAGPPKPGPAGQRK